MAFADGWDYVRWDFGGRVDNDDGLTRCLKMACDSCYYENLSYTISFMGTEVTDVCWAVWVVEGDRPDPDDGVHYVRRSRLVCKGSDRHGDPVTRTIMYNGNGIGRFVRVTTGDVMVFKAWRRTSSEDVVCVGTVSGFLVQR